MKNIVKTVKTLEIIWPCWVTAVSVCRALNRLEEDLVPYWEPYWNGKRDEIGIRFASEEGEIESFPGSVVTIEDRYAVRMRKPTSKECDLTTTIGEKKRDVAHVYDGDSLEDLKALSERGLDITIRDGGCVVCDMLAEGYWLVTEPDWNGEAKRVAKLDMTLEWIAESYKGKLV